MEHKEEKMRKYRFWKMEALHVSDIVLLSQFLDRKILAKDNDDKDCEYHWKWIAIGIMVLHINLLTRE